MDNVTHALAGLLLAEAVFAVRARKNEEPSRGFVLTARLVSVAANNLPDLDVLYAGITGGKLGYLLHHRGHTHTLAVGVLISAAIMASCVPFRARFGRADWAWIGALAFVGPLVHLLLDFTNNYGLHPFWPFDTRWFYGDAVFIVEPWLWVAAVPSLIFSTGSLPYRVALALVLGLGVLLAGWVEFVPWGVALALTIASLAALALTRRLARTPRVVFGVAGWLAVTLVFVLGSRAARARIPGEPIDVVLTPGPGNPLCFSALVIDADAGLYRLRLATVASAPAILPVERCRVEGWEPNVRLGPVEDANTPHAVRWFGEWSAPAEELRALARDNCEAAAFLRFARAPYWLSQSADELYLGDLRYDRSPSPGFSELSAPKRPLGCPRHIPPWRPPREEILAGGQRARD